MVLAKKWMRGKPEPSGAFQHFAGECSLESADSILKVYDTVTDTKTWMCLICGWIYDEALGAPDDGIAPGTLWADVPMNWVCPECGARKEDFELVQI
jgi:rubredoxin